MHKTNSAIILSWVQVALFIIIASGLIFFTASAVFAEGDDDTSTTTEETVAVDDAVDEEALDDEFSEEEQEELDSEYEDLDVDIPDEAPGNFGLWWRGVKERVSITFTFDPVKKAEKALEFAVERQTIAEQILAKSTDEKAIARAEKVLDRATDFITRVEERKDDIVAGSGVRVEALQRNLIRFQKHSGEVFERIEERFIDNPEKAERFAEVKERVIEKHEALLERFVDGAGENIRERLQHAKDRAHDALEESRAFREEVRELKESGDDDALEALFEERKEEIDEKQEKREEFRMHLEEKKDDLEARAADGDEKAERALRAMDHVQQVTSKIKERIEEKHEARVEIRDGVSEIKLETRTEIRDVRAEAHDALEELREDLDDADEEGRVEIHDAAEELREEARNTKVEIRDHAREALRELRDSDDDSDDDDSDNEDEDDLDIQ